MLQFVDFKPLTGRIEAWDQGFANQAALLLVGWIVDFKAWSKRILSGTVQGVAGDQILKGTGPRIWTSIDGQVKAAAQGRLLAKHQIRPAIQRLGEFRRPRIENKTQCIRHWPR
ncbi:hypothetical protein KQ313_02190 [Synechococcus sp. CS-1325]|uniref:hypothetical protein n=1 Tax=unclassified Synechococcus TaxID=2626047 RepID=UPI0021A35D4C|nr:MULTISPECIES: hypothetical protein [unclassified Synechococcus]MCT0198498.1 hypothetical protein [Synechococcus sp. CS-1325]MCT0229864.1 hypothetical protein [Synechococcus sp. CS-1324]